MAPGTSFVIPPNPGQLNIPSGTNIVTSGNLHHDHTEAAREFKEWINLERAGEKQTAEAVSKIFLARVFDRNRGFSHLRARDIVTHLFTEYREGGEPRPRRKSREDVRSLVHEQVVPGIGATGPVNPIIRG